MFASRASTWPRDHLCRSTIAPRRSTLAKTRSMLSVSMPIVATGKFDLLDMAVLLCLIAPSKHHSLEGREHGHTIPLTGHCLGPVSGSQWLESRPLETPFERAPVFKPR